MKGKLLIGGAVVAYAYAGLCLFFASEAAKNKDDEYTKKYLLHTATGVLSGTAFLILRKLK